MRQDVLDAMAAKLTINAVKTEFDKVDDEHNKVHNPSGAPYKGEAKRSAVQGPTPEEETNAKVYPPGEDVPRSKEDFDPSMVFPGIDVDHELVIKEGRLYVHALHDCIVTARKPLIRI